MKEDIIRILRIVEYVGRRSWVEKTVAESIHGTKKIHGSEEIRAATIGAFPEILKEAESS